VVVVVVVVVIFIVVVVVVVVGVVDLIGDGRDLGDDREETMIVLGAVLTTDLIMRALRGILDVPGVSVLERD